MSLLKLWAKASRGRRLNIKRVILFPLIVYTEYILMVIVCGLTFPSVRISLAALLEGLSDYLYESARRVKSFIPYCLKKVRND